MLSTRHNLASYFCLPLLPTILALILFNASPVISGYVTVRNIASQDNSTTSSDPLLDGSPQSITYPLIQLAVLGPIIALTILLIWCLCRGPFKNRRLLRRSQAYPPAPTLRRDLHRFDSSMSSATSIMSTETRLVGSPLSPPLFKDEKKLHRSDGNDDDLAQMPICVGLPGVPPPAHTRPAL